MGQNEIDAYLKRNKDKWFTALDLGIALKCNEKNIYASLKVMRKKGELLTRTVRGALPNKDVIQYCYKDDDRWFDAVIKDVKIKKNQFGALVNENHIMQCMIIAQNKRIIELLEQLNGIVKLGGKNEN